MKNKSAGCYLSLISAVLGLAGLIVFLVYTGKGGAMNPIVIAASVASVACSAAALLGERTWTDFTSVIAAPLLALAMLLSLQGGIGNIADQVNGIVMFGDARLANLNYVMVIIYGLATVAAIIASFLKKSK